MLDFLLKKHHILYMWSMREHVDRLYGCHLVCHVEQL